MNKIESEVLMSGKTTFRLEVPYKLIETGVKSESKPLIVYLHGYGQNIEQFEKICKPLLSTKAYHLFIQGPYPIYDTSRKVNVSKWGRAWYLYDGNRGQFIKSLEITSEFIQSVIDRMLKIIHPERISILGYSMGGYQAGYFALTRWKHINELIVLNARVKTEVVHDNWENLKHLNILALHGKNDESVKHEPQKSEIEKLKKADLNAKFKMIDASHKLNRQYFDEIKDWQKKLGYN